MSYFDEDAREMLEVYLLETRQLTEQLNNCLMEAEKNNRFAEEDIHGIFRVMHTIKSSSAMMGLSQLSSLAHKLEDIFAYYREEIGTIENPEQGIFDLMFLAADHISAEMERMETEDYEPADIKQIVEQAEAYWEKFCCSHEKEELPEEQAPEPQSCSYFGDKSGTVVNVIFEQGCRLENVRAFMLVRQISGLCSELETYPPDLEQAGVSSEIIGKQGLFVRFISEQREEVLEVMEKGLFVNRVILIADQEEAEASAEESEPLEAQPKKLQEVKETEFLDVKAEKLDKMQNLSCEMVIQMLVLDEALRKNGLEDLREGTARQISQLISEMERTTMEMRMRPINRIVPKLRRILRDICRDEGKEAELIVNCGDIEADKSVVESCSEALMHLIRNAVDHGIETAEVRQALGKEKKGRIVFQVESTVGELVLTLSDDGCGLDDEKILNKAKERGMLVKPEAEYSSEEIHELILKPGFTTNETVNEYSGRGVGLDVVKNIMEEIGGHLHIESQPGVGSKFTLIAPLTLSTVESACFQIGDYHFSMPARYVFNFMEYREKKRQIRQIDGRSYILYDGRMVPLINLRKVCGIKEEIPDDSIVIYVKDNRLEGCLLADVMHEQKRIVVKSLPNLLGRDFRKNTGIGGCSIMGDGDICAALDLENLIVNFEKEGAYE
ncbi:ATP-binding protein [Emergencia sp.]|uniref:ATP-binding protein n=1 Tax=Emergencia sp. TaxID=1926557 RepID=UPI003AF1585D